MKLKKISFYLLTFVLNYLLMLHYVTYITYVICQLIYLHYLLTYFAYLLLIYSLMPSDMHNSRTARAIELTSLLPEMCVFTSHSSYTVHASWCYPCTPFVSPFYFYSHIYIGEDLRQTRIMVTVQDIKIAEALLVVFHTYNVMKRVRHCWNRAFTYQDMECMFHQWSSLLLFNGWMDCTDTLSFALLCLCYCVTDIKQLNMNHTGLWVFQ